MFLTWLCIECCSGFFFFIIIIYCPNYSLVIREASSWWNVVWFPRRDLSGRVKPYLMHYGDLEWKIALSVTVCPLLRTVFQTAVPYEWNRCRPLRVNQYYNKDCNHKSQCFQLLKKKKKIGNIEWLIFSVSNQRSGTGEHGFVSHMCNLNRTGA